MRSTIRLRIAIPYVVLIVVFMGGLSLYLSNYVRTSYEDKWKTDLLATDRLLALQLDSSIDPTAVKGALDAQAQDYARQLNTRVTIIRADGVVLANRLPTSTRWKTTSPAPRYCRLSRTTRATRYVSAPH
jgi:hypothetical protein